MKTILSIMYINCIVTKPVTFSKETRSLYVMTVKHSLITL